MPRQNFDPIEESGVWGWIGPATAVLFFLILMLLPWLKRAFIELVGRDDTEVRNQRHRRPQSVKKEKHEQHTQFMKQMRQRQ
jgi:hypothetical protein